MICSILFVRYINDRNFVTRLLYYCSTVTVNVAMISFLHRAGKFSIMNHNAINLVYKDGRPSSSFDHYTYRVFRCDLYKRWASPRKKLTRLAHETSYLDYSIPSFKVPGVFGALVTREVCFWHQNYQKEFLLKLRLKCFLGVFDVNSRVL